MKFGNAIIISLLAILALVAEIILYFVLGVGTALGGATAALGGATAALGDATTVIGGLAFVFLGSMVLTVAAAILAPVGAVLELAVKRPNLGVWVFLGGLAAVSLGYAGILSSVYYMRRAGALSSVVGTGPHGSQTGESPAPSAVIASAVGSLENPTPSLEVKLLRKRLSKQSYQDYVFFDLEWRATGLSKATRAIKGVLQLQDLFGETRMKLKWTVDKPLAPGEVFVEKGAGFEYNMFMSGPQWVNSTDLSNMKARFVVTNILYQDGTTEEIKLP